MQVSAEISAVLRSESLGTLKDLADGFMEAFCGVVFAIEMVVNNKSVVSAQLNVPETVSVLNMSLKKFATCSVTSAATKYVTDSIISSLHWQPRVGSHTDEPMMLCTHCCTQRI